MDTLKQRLDSLRKAKNTTIVKREREEINVHSPRLGQRRPPQLPLPKLHQSNSQSSIHSGPNGTSSPPGMSVMERELLDQLEESRRERDRLSGELLSCRCQCEEKERTMKEEMQEMEKRHREEVAGLKGELKQAKEISPLSASLTPSKLTPSPSLSLSLSLSFSLSLPPPLSQKLLLLSLSLSLSLSLAQCAMLTSTRDELSSELEKLRMENTELVGQLQDLVTANEGLRESNQLLQGKCEMLMEDLSVKEARWSDREEKLKAEVGR